VSKATALQALELAKKNVWDLQQVMYETQEYKAVQVALENLYAARYDYCVAYHKEIKT